VGGGAAGAVWVGWQEGCHWRTNEWGGERLALNLALTSSYSARDAARSPASTAALPALTSAAALPGSHSTASAAYAAAWAVSFAGVVGVGDECEASGKARGATRVSGEEGLANPGRREPARTTAAAPTHPLQRIRKPQVDGRS
jgi:hypothetical protein